MEKKIFQADKATFEVLAQTFHSHEVTGLDVCMRKPLLATCSTDKSIRIWNFETWSVSLILTYLLKD
jgi:WD40 repeat protein